MKATAPVHRIALLDCDRLSNKYQRQRRPQKDQRPLTSQPDGQLSGHRQQDRVNVGGGRGSATLSPGAVAGSMFGRPRMILVSSNEKLGYLAPGRASRVLVGLNHRPASG